jgi:hypothetical protein
MMKKLLAAVALAIALPAMAHAQAASAPAPAPEKKCCCEEMGKPMKCCDKHGEAGHDEHAGDDMVEHQQPQH